MNYLNAFTVVTGSVNDYRERSSHMTPATGRRYNSYGTDSSSTLIDRAFEAGSFEDEEEMQFAAASSRIAKRFLSRRPMVRVPDHISFGDSGVVSLRWGSGRAGGLIIIFSGTEQAAFSIKQAGQSFTDNLVEFAPLSDVPAELVEALKDA